MKRALLILAARQPAVFTERAATEGQHQTLGHPPGSALLGFAASKLYDGWKSGRTAFDVFHSGKVRFSNALPLAASGHAVYPMPQLLTELKHARGGTKKEKNTVLDREIVRLVYDKLRVGCISAKSARQGSRNADDTSKTE